MIRIIRVDQDQWSEMGEEAHRAVFGTTRTWAHERADYALLALNRKNNPIGYITVNDHDKDTAHWQYGGVFEDYANTLIAFRAFQAAVEWSSVFYSQVLCTVSNDNARMIRFLNKVGFKICGVRTYQGSTLVEHILRLR